jgi:immune inhibitor A
MTTLLENYQHIYAAAKRSEDGQRCCVSPSPEVQERMRAELTRLRRESRSPMAARLGFRPQARVGFNDGLIVPGTELPLGAPPSVARSVAIRRGAAKAGPKTLNVAVVLIGFTDKPMAADRKQYFADLFFSTGKIATGSVKEYFADVTGKKVNIAGQVVGPYIMPQTLATYAGGGSGIDNPLPNARTMARDAAVLADADVDFSKYDNDGDGFTDAYVIVHAGRGAEETMDPGDIWSHKWVLSGGALNVDGSKIFAYLTVPEDAKLGVCAHELGHLLFGFPDLYDTDGDGEGVGNWCLMGGGSWNGGGHTPAHPSAWCKAQQKWATIENISTNANRTIKSVQLSRKILRLWKNGAASQEYFLAEYRDKKGYDKHLPGEGLLVWHIDDTIDGNSNQLHPKVALMQADGLKQLEAGSNRGDAGDAYPGTTNNINLKATTNPNTLSYGGLDSQVEVTMITPVADGVTAYVKVRQGAAKVASTKKSGKKTAKAATARTRPKAA